MNTSNKTLSLMIGTAFVASVAAANVHAAENPFAMKTLSSGYMVAEADKMKDGKCGTGKCSAEMKAKQAKEAKEGSCSADKKAEGSCSADKKAKEGSCSGDMKAKEGSCHADKK